jgi:hypothetical protein
MGMRVALKVIRDVGQGHLYLRPVCTRGCERNHAYRGRKLVLIRWGNSRKSVIDWADSSGAGNSAEPAHFWAQRKVARYGSGAVNR